MAVGALTTDRLELVSMSPAFIEALLDGRRVDAERLLGAEIPPGWPNPHDARFLRGRLAQIASGAQEQRWLVYAVVLREEARLVGHAGFHGNPGVNEKGRPDGVEIGYTIFEADRGRGYAVETVRALIAYARAEGMGVVVASVSPENEPSLAIVRKLGFVETGSHWDEEDGEELEFELELGPPPA